jgi:hypothetical protein
MADDREKFVSRWSRLKREARERTQSPPPKPETPADSQAPPPELPPLDKLNFDSDYRGFFHPKIDEDTRRAALKKLFSDARFNVIDQMDIDIEDYSKYTPLSAAVVASLKQTQNILQWAREREEDEERKRRLADDQTRLAEKQNVEAQPGATDASDPAPSKPADETAHAPSINPEDDHGNKA